MPGNPYPGYERTGVTWFTELPSRWKAVRLKHTATYRVSSVNKIPVEGELPVRLCNYTDVYYNEEIGPKLDFMEATATPEEVRRFALHPGDVVITKDSEDWRDIAVPAYVRASAPDLVCGYHLAIISPRAGNLDGRYLLRALQAGAVNQQFQVATTGVTRHGLPKSAIGDAWLPVPPLEDQVAIATFLDRETARIDTLIEKKRTLIERLKEKRSALISRTVTRGLPPEAAKAAGLNPHPRMKDSGVEWLGEVPEHWEVKPLKWAVMFQRGHDLPTDDREEGDIPLVSSSGVSSTHSQAIAKGPGIVTGRYGTIGTFHFVEQDYWPLNTTLYSIDLRGNEPRFLTLVLSHLAPLFLLNAVKSAVPGVDRNDIHSISVAVPPLHEQEVIASFLEREGANGDMLTAKVEGAIERLAEYRAALITAAVTGKIDVRESAP